MPMEIPELSKMWEEKVAVEVTEDQTKDPFVPAKIAEPFNPDQKITVRGYNGQSKDFEQELVIRIEL